ncbi:GldG family protein [Candidatus Roizmanbacteria bacterium]|nr:GldG family protein [Candidatus Roizmanbacteria bacterium]
MLKNLRRLNFVAFFNLKGKERQLIFSIVIVLFLVINLSLSSLSFRLDTSYGKAYTLSNSTKKILRNLDDLVTIKFFASSDLPTRLLPLKTDVVDLLNEYKKDGRGKIQMKILDPKKDQEAANDAKESGVPEIQFSQLEQNKYAVTASFFGIVLAYGEKKEVLPQVTDLENLEYNLTASIYKLVKKELVKIGMVGFTDSFDPKDDKIATLKKILSQQFDIEYLDISTQSASKTINNSIKTVVVFDREEKGYDDHELKLLKDYLDKKGKAIFIANGVSVSESLTTSSTNHNLFSLLRDFGINLEKNLVLSTSAELVNFGNEQVSLVAPYPFWIRTNNFNQATSYFSNLTQLTYPWVSSIKLEKKKGIETKELVKTNKQSWEQKDNFTLNPQAITQPKDNELKEFLIAAESAKEGKGKIVVIPSSRFVLEQFMGRTSDNLEFVLNILNDLASGGALSGIRSRAVSFYPVPEIPNNQKDIFKYANILFLPALFSIIGAFRLLKRR